MDCDHRSEPTFQLTVSLATTPPYSCGNATCADVEIGCDAVAAIRIVDPGEKAAAWQQGFLLPEIPALREPASLVLPAGTFKLDRSVEIMIDQQAQVVKLFRILDHGVEFERCNMHARE